MPDVAHGPHPPPRPIPRPPTPPKENVQEAAQMPTDQSYQATVSQHLLLDTPNDSPSSSSEYFAGSGGTLHKRVVFSPWHEYHTHTTDNRAVVDAKLRSLPPSRECIASRKPILKASPAVPFLQPLVFDPDQGLAVMLQSVTGRLTQDSRDLRLDTYKTLLGCLAAHDNVPKTQTLVDHLSGFLDFIRRDIVAKQPATATFDTELVTSALKILSAMVCTQSLVDAMPEDFCTFVAEKAISSLEHQETPKIMVDHYMQLLGRQRFPERVVNPARMNRLLNSLNGLEDRVKGNRVIGLKIMIYQRLLLQAKNLMVGRAGQWLEFLIVCLASSIKDIRIRAIAFGTDAALALGETATVSQTCLDLLNREHPSGAKVVDSLGSRMHDLLNDKDGAIHVPQIWSVVVLFLRSRHHQIERWEHLTNWFGIMQHSFNSSDAKVKRQANIAWNRLVSAISLDTSTGLSMIKMLRQPIAAQLERKSSDKHLKAAKQVACSSYCNLLYFAFRPQPPQEQLDLYWKRLDLYWENFVVPVLSPKASSTESDHAFACQVLAAVLSSPEPRSWEQNRAHQASLLIKPEELPCLDPRWVRHRASKIISMLEGFLLHTNCPSLDDFQKSHFFVVWQSFAKALGEAASKDVHKVYLETMAALAQFTSMLNRYWHQKDGTTEVFLRRLEVCTSLINETLAKVGFRPFVEKRLLRDSSGSAFEAAETPSSRSSHSRRYLNTSIMYILEFLVNNSHGTETSASYKEAIQELLTIALHAASGKRRRLAIIRQLATDVLSRPYVTIPSRVVFWNCLAREAEAVLALPKTKTPASDSPQHPGQDYWQCIQLLELGFRESASEIYPSWKSLSDVLLKDIENEVGEAGIVLAYTEPIASVLLEFIKNGSDTCWRYGSYIVYQARWPLSRKESERARKQLWGPEQPVSKEASLDAFLHLYTMVETLLTSAYSSPQSASLDAVVEFITSVTSFVHRCPLSMKAVCMEKMQLGLTVWIEDANAILAPMEDTRMLYPAMKVLWKTIVEALESVAKPDSNFLKMFKDLLKAGFRSRHRSVVNSMITVWNRIFVGADSLEYPDALQAVLMRLRTTVDLELPGFVDHAEPEKMSSPVKLLDSQEEGIAVKPGSAAAKASRLLMAPASHSTIRFRKTASHSPGTPSARVSRRQPRMTPKAAFRHNDSQIEFAAIDSSPLNPGSGDTQHLTDHQKETRERQDNDAPMFKDIRSGPRAPQSAERPIELKLHKKQITGKPLDVDAEPSPTFPPGDATMNEFLGSSPTPHASSRSSVDHNFDDDPGSSPPFSPMPTVQRLPTGVTNRLEIANPPKAPLSAVGISQSPNAPAAASLAPSNSLNALENKTGFLDSPSAHKGVDVEHDSTQHSEQTSPKTANLLRSDRHDLVENPADPVVETLVDASISKAPGDQNRNPVDCHMTRAVPEPTTPTSINDTRPKPADTSISETTESIEKSLLPAEPSTPTEDELVREQLLRDLEEASSQTDSQVPKRRPSLSSPSEASRKRKILSKDSVKPRKKLRPELPSSSQTVEVVVETRRKDQDGDDYYVIDDRPAAGTEMPSSPVVKQERSHSPARNVQPSCSQNSHAKKASVRPRTRSMVGGKSPQASDAVDCNTQLASNSELAESSPVKQPSRKRRRSAQSQDQSPEESKRRRSQDNRPLYTPFTANVQEGVIEEKDISSSQMEGIKEALLSSGESRREAHGTSSDLSPSNRTGGDTIPNTPVDDAPQAHEASSTRTVGRSPGQRMLDRFKSLLHDLRNVTLWPAEEKEMMKVALEVVGGVHEAGFRNGRREQ
ncbi:MAG: hypothetical protein Q9226_000277 [Calogaya cf. arnoldii]